MKTKLLDLLNGVKWSNRLLTTVLMTFLLFAVLSTATFAWYTVANIASVGDISFTAASNTGGGGDICLSWHELEADEYSFKLDFATVPQSNGLNPMIPINEAVVGQTQFNAYAGQDAFNKASQVENIAGGYVTKLDSITPATPYVLNEKNGDGNVIYVTNKADIDMTVTFTYEVNAELYLVNGTDVWLKKPIANKLRAAVFIAEQGDEDFTLVGLCAEDGQVEEKIHYGALEGNKNVNDVDSQSKSQSITFVVPAKSFVTCKIAVWFDGVRMLDSDGSGTVSFDMYFEGSAYLEE